MLRPVLVPVALLLAAAATLPAHHVPGFDAHGWLLWGRDITSGGLGALDTSDYPSWKPLPALLTTPLALAGAAAPALWLVVARAGALLAAVLAYRLASTFAGRVAGVLAATGVLLLDLWLQLAARGAIEPLLAALLLGAADRHLARRPRQVVVLLALAALGRHEALVLLGLYALWLVRERPARIPALGAAVLAVPALWLGGDWIGAGDPFHGTTLARDAEETILANAQGDAPLLALRTFAEVVGVPLLLGAIAGLVLAWRRRAWGLLVVGGAVVVWVGIDVVLAAGGLPAIGRFMVPPAALACVLGAVGIVEGVRLAGSALGSPRARIALGGAVAVAVAPFAVSAARGTADQAELERWYARTARGLDQALDRAGGVERVRRSGWTSSTHLFEARLAWRLGVNASGVGPRDDGPGLVFMLPGFPYPELDLAIAPGARRVPMTRLGDTGGWTIWGVRRRRGPRGPRRVVECSGPPKARSCVLRRPEEARAAEV